MQHRLARRTVIRGSAAILFAGAGCLWTTIEDLSLQNNTGDEVPVTTVVTRVSDESEILSDTSTIPAEESRQYQNPIRKEGRYRIHISVVNGPENTYAWDAPSDDAYGVLVTINPSEIEFAEMVH